jgi:hypothetical protein
MLLIKFAEINSILIIIEQVASNKTSLLLKNIFQNTQALQLFTIIIKTESIHKNN